VAENSGGPHCLKYGMTVNHVLGLEVFCLPANCDAGGGGVDVPGYDCLGCSLARKAHSESRPRRR